MPDTRAVPLTANTIERAREVLERLTAAGIKASVRVDPQAPEDLGRLGQAVPSGLAGNPDPTIHLDFMALPKRRPGGARKVAG